MTWRSARPGIQHAFRAHRLVSLCGHQAWRDTRSVAVGDLVCADCQRRAQEQS